MSISKPVNDQTQSRRQTLYGLPPAQSTRSSTSDLISAPQLTGGATFLTTSADHLPARTSTPVLHPPSVIDTSSAVRLGTPPPFDMAEGVQGAVGGLGAIPKTVTTTVAVPTTSSTAANATVAGTPPTTVYVPRFKESSVRAHQIW